MERCRRQLHISQSGCDNYLKLTKSTENLPKSKLPKTNPNANRTITLTGFIRFRVKDLQLGLRIEFGLVLVIGNLFFGTSR